MARPRKIENQRPQEHGAPQAKRDLRKFAGKQQKTDFSFLKEAFPDKYGDKVFRLITDDEGGARHFDYVDRGWEEVTITSEMVNKDRRLRRFIREKDGAAGSTIRIPVNPNNPDAGKYGILMMKSRAAFEEEERAALAAEVERTEQALKQGENQSGVGGIETYAPDTGDGKTRGFRSDLSDSLA
jgi:hypothetical protein